MVCHVRGLMVCVIYCYWTSRGIVCLYHLNFEVMSSFLGLTLFYIMRSLPRMVGLSSIWPVHRQTNSFESAS